MISAPKAEFVARASQSPLSRSRLPKQVEKSTGILPRHHHLRKQRAPECWSLRSQCYWPRTCPNGRITVWRRESGPIIDVTCSNPSPRRQNMLSHDLNTSDRVPTGPCKGPNRLKLEESIHGAQSKCVSAYGSLSPSTNRQINDCLRIVPGSSESRAAPRSSSCFIAPHRKQCSFCLRLHPALEIPNHGPTNGVGGRGEIRMMRDSEVRLHVRLRVACCTEALNYWNRQDTPSVCIPHHTTRCEPVKVNTPFLPSTLFTAALLPLLRRLARGPPPLWRCTGTLDQGCRIRSRISRGRCSPRRAVSILDLPDPDEPMRSTLAACRFSSSVWLWCGVGDGFGCGVGCGCGCGV